MKPANGTARSLLCLTPCAELYRKDRSATWRHDDIVERQVRFKRRRESVTSLLSGGIYRLYRSDENSSSCRNRYAVL